MNDNKPTEKVTTKLIRSDLDRSPLIENFAIDEEQKAIIYKTLLIVSILILINWYAW